ncbi:MAG: type II secretion system protein [Candidatus Riflebacteria bacterium]|nr:type II secretion system protein [Candidatus Riflebacteria bacterium]
MAGGFSLVEILVAIVILLAVLGPVWSVFSGSRRAVRAARELSLAASLSSSLLAGLKNAAPGVLCELAPTVDSELPGGLALSSLGVGPAPTGYTRRLALRRLAGWGSAREPMFRADLRIDWVTPRHDQTLTYQAVGIVQGRPPAP